MSALTIIKEGHLDICEPLLQLFLAAKICFCTFFQTCTFSFLCSNAATHMPNNESQCPGPGNRLWALREIPSLEQSATSPNWALSQKYESGKPIHVAQSPIRMQHLPSLRRYVIACAYSIQRVCMAAHFHLLPGDRQEGFEKCWRGYRLLRFFSFLCFTLSWDLPISNLRRKTYRAPGTPELSSC